MAALDVLPLADAKVYLNITTTAHDDELEKFIGAAVARVDKHLGLDQPGEVSLAEQTELTPLQRLAVEMVLAEYWRTQRISATNRSTYVAQPWEDDDGPAGTASLRARLTDLLGEPAATKRGTGAAPQGTFPSATPWPDPADRGRWCW